MWNKNTGEPVYNAIVWQCRRTAEMIDRLKAEGFDKVLREKTGLVADAYFSASKIAWILENVPGAREAAENGNLRFGTGRYLADLEAHRRACPCDGLHQRLPHHAV